MNLIQRAKNILTTPKTEWDVVAAESATMGSLLTSYVLPLSLIPVVATLLNGLVWGGIIWGMKYTIVSAVIAFVNAIISYVIATYAIDLLATNFKSEKNMNSSAQLAAYSCTAMWVVSILGIIPFLGWLGMLAGAAYTVYLMYLGTGPVKKTPEDQRIVYVIVVIVIVIVVHFIIQAILGGIMFTAVLGGMGGAFNR
jgi:hypothetical protein